MVDFRNPAGHLWLWMVNAGAAQDEELPAALRAPSAERERARGRAEEEGQGVRGQSGRAHPRVRRQALYARRRLLSAPSNCESISFHFSLQPLNSSLSCPAYQYGVLSGRRS